MNKIYYYSDQQRKKKTKRNLFVNCGVYSKIIKYANTLIKKKNN